MRKVARILAALLAVFLVVPVAGPIPSASAADGTCIHVDVHVSADGQLLTKGPQIAQDGGVGHAGTGHTFTFQAQTFAPSQDWCALKLSDSRSWHVSGWPCENYPRPEKARTQSLTWAVTVPRDCEVFSSPGLLSASLTNGSGSAGGDVMIYAGAPGFVLPDKQARGMFGPFAMQSDPVNSLTGALTAVETDAEVRALGVPLTVSRTYNSNDTSGGTLGPGWRSSYSDRLAIKGDTATYLAPDGREIGFTRSGAGYTVEKGVARFGLVRSGAGFVLTSFDQLRMYFSLTGELTAIRDRNGQGVVIRRTDGRLAAVTGGRRSLSYAYNEAGLISTVTLTAPGAEPRVVRYGFTDGRLSQVTSPGGIVTRYGYDDGGRLSTQSNGSAAKPLLTTQYGENGRVVSQTDGKGARSTWEWSSAGIHGTSTMTDPTGGKWTNEYERNWLVRQVDPTGARVSFHYDAAGNLTQVFDGLGHGARHAYDGRGRVISSTDAAGNVTRRAYNGFNDVVSVTDPLGRRTTFGYDGRGNLLTTSYAGRSTRADYDTRGLQTSSRDVLGRTSRFAYSADGDLVRSTDPAGRVTTYRTDGWGRPITVTPPRGHSPGAGDAFSTHLVHSADDQLLEQRGPLGVVTKQAYDDQGRPAGVIDGRGGESRFRYDDAGQLVGVTGPDKSLPEATVELDGSGRMTKRTDASGRPQTFEYDGGGRLTATTYGERTWRFGYDKVGRLVRTTLPSGKSASFTLDPRGAMTRVDYSDKTPSVQFAWDAAGRRTSMTDALGVTRFKYDGFDRLVSVARPGATVSYQWDAVGNLVARAAGGHTESYQWDKVDRLSAMKLDGRLAASYSYDLTRGSITTRRPSGLVEVRSLDARNREIEVQLTQAGEQVRSVTSAYDSSDNLIRSNDSAAGKAAYTYDPLSRLTAVCYGVEECSGDAKDYIKYGYDGAGNKTWEERPRGSTWSMYGAGSELLASLTVPAGYPRELPTWQVFDYDADGNLASDGKSAHTWSAAGKPVSSEAGATTTTYVHGGDGRRLSETASGKTTRYLWDLLSPQILGVSDGKSSSRYGYGAGLVAQVAAGKATEVVSGRSGSLLATNGTAVAHHDFEPYGASRPTGGADSKSPGPGFTGGLRLPNGNYLLGQREYNPTTGVFLSPDQGGSGQAYAYASGNPLSFSDLTGMDDIDGTLTDVSTVSGWATTASLAAAVGCTVIRACAPAVPIFLQISAATGMAAAGSAGVLDAQACVVKGNCSALAADVAVGVLASRLPGIGAHARRASAVSGGATETAPHLVRPPLSIPKQQFGRKWGKHASDYHLAPGDMQARLSFEARVRDVHRSPDEVRRGLFHDWEGAFFFRKGNDLLIVQPDGTFVSMYPGAGTSSWFKAAEVFRH